MRGTLTAHIDYEVQSALALALSAVESAECKILVDCPEGQSTPISLPPINTITEDICTVIECGGATLQVTELHLSYW